METYWRIKGTTRVLKMYIIIFEKYENGNLLAYGVGYTNIKRTTKIALGL